MLLKFQFLLVFKFLLVSLELLQALYLVVVVAILFILLQFCVLLHTLHKVDVGTVLLQETVGEQLHLCLGHSLQLVPPGFFVFKIVLLHLQHGQAFNVLIVLLFLRQFAEQLLLLGSEFFVN